MEMFKYNKNEIGIDEAGRGPFFGPVFAGAVIWGDAVDNELVKDSKKLSVKKRKIVKEWIEENVLAFGIGSCSSKEIDELGILPATQLAMERAVDMVLGKINKNKVKVPNVLIDGIGWENRSFSFDIKLESIVKGDDKYRNIAAASILAKEYHDEAIINICKDNDLNEKYDLLKNKGYGTKKHREGISKHGLSEHHRYSFKI
jgi:ribonuclease HII